MYNFVQSKRQGITKNLSPAHLFPNQPMKLTKRGGRLDQYISDYSLLEDLVTNDKA